jgi:hypothetical protein
MRDGVPFYFRSTISSYQRRFLPSCAEHVRVAFMKMIGEFMKKHEKVDKNRGVQIEQIYAQVDAKFKDFYENYVDKDRLPDQPVSYQMTDGKAYTVEDPLSLEVFFFLISHRHIQRLKLPIVSMDVQLKDFIRFDTALDVHSEREKKVFLLYYKTWKKISWENEDLDRSIDDMIKRIESMESEEARQSKNTRELLKNMSDLLEDNIENAECAHEIVNEIREHLKDFDVDTELKTLLNEWIETTFVTKHGEIVGIRESRKFEHDTPLPGIDSMLVDTDRMLQEFDNMDATSKLRDS